MSLVSVHFPCFRLVCFSSDIYIYIYIYTYLVVDCIVYYYFFYPSVKPFDPVERNMVLSVTPTLSWITEFPGMRSGLTELRLGLKHAGRLSM
jgi:hypothetical protein